MRPDQQGFNQETPRHSGLGRDSIARAAASQMPPAAAYEAAAVNPYDPSASLRHRAFAQASSYAAHGYAGATANAMPAAANPALQSFLSLHPNLLSSSASTSSATSAPSSSSSSAQSISSAQRQPPALHVSSSSTSSSAQDNLVSSAFSTSPASLALPPSAAFAFSSTAASSSSSASAVPAPGGRSAAAHAIASRAEDFLASQSQQQLPAPTSPPFLSASQNAQSQMAFFLAMNQSPSHTIAVYNNAVSNVEASQETFLPPRAANSSAAHQVLMNVPPSAGHQQPPISWHQKHHQTHSQTAASSALHLHHQQQQQQSDVLGHPYLDQQHHVQRQEHAALGNIQARLALLRDEANTFASPAPHFNPADPSHQDTLYLRRHGSNFAGPNTPPLFPAHLEDAHTTPRNSQVASAVLSGITPSSLQSFNASASTAALSTTGRKRKRDDPLPHFHNAPAPPSASATINTFPLPNMQFQLPPPLQQGQQDQGGNARHSQAQLQAHHEALQRLSALGIDLIALSSVLGQNEDIASFAYLANTKLKELRSLRPIERKDDGFYCMLCAKSFNYKQHLQTHIRTVHLGIKSHQCDRCRKRFGEKSALTKHVKTVHARDRPYQCAKCGSTFGQKAHLNKHHQSKFGCGVRSQLFSQDPAVVSHLYSPLAEGLRGVRLGRSDDEDDDDDDDDDDDKHGDDGGLDSNQPSEPQTHRPRAPTAAPPLEPNQRPEHASEGQHRH